MQHRPGLARILFVALACVLAFGAARVAPAKAGPTHSEVKLLRSINHARTSHGVRRVRFGSTIQDAAHRWSRYLLIHDAFYHGRIAVGTSENIGWLTCRHHWAGALVRMWLNSPTHRVHLLDGSVRRVGVGVTRGSWSRYSCVRMAVTRFR